MKQQNARKRGISLVIVPCWWDGSLESLSTTISFQRPDLIQHHDANPIPLNPPSGYFHSSGIPGIGELMYASFPEDFSISKNNWWLGEKYDGVRSCWHHELQRAYSRTGIPFVLPCNIYDSTKINVDSEFWFGRGQYMHSYLLLQGNPDNVAWNMLRILAFDTVPSMKDGSSPFEDRYRCLLANTSPTSPCLVSRHVQHFDSQFRQLMKEIIEDSGEGVILRKKESLYEHGTKSASLLKFKSSPADQEGVVTEIDEEGITLELANGVTFNVPTDHVQTPQPVQVGEVVTFSYDSNSRRQVPQNAVVYRRRLDMTWNDVLASQHDASPHSTSRSQFTTVPQNYWSDQTMRHYMEQYTLSKGKDPSLPTTWHDLDLSEIYANKQGKAIMKKLKGFSNAVVHLFPEFGFGSNFRKVQLSEVGARRKFFEEYAKDNGFDPLQPNNWYMQEREKMKLVKSAYGVIKYHKGSISKALVDLFPEIGLVKSKFTGSWHNKDSRRDFFEEYALDSGFDPLDPECWYLESRGNILKKKGAFQVMAYHDNSFKTALLDLFPDIGLDTSKIWSPSWSQAKALKNLFPEMESQKHKPSWFEPKADNRKQFFIDFAKTNGFSHLEPENWYSITKHDVVTMKIYFRELDLIKGGFIQKSLQLEVNQSFYVSVSPPFESVTCGGSGDSVSVCELIMPLATRIINHEEALSIETSTIDGLESDLQFFTLPITFTIQSKNPSGEILKRGGERFAIKIIGPPPTNTRVSSKVLDKRDGDYNVTFEPTLPGKHIITVTHYGRQLTGSPFTIDVEEAADSETSSMVKFMFKVQARNTSGKAKKKGGDKFEVFVAGPDGPVDNIQVSDIKDGSYLIQWSPNEPGEYWIDATLNSNTVTGFPWGLVI